MKFDCLGARLDFVVLENQPFDVVISRTKWRCLGGVLDFKEEEVGLDYHDQQAVLPKVSKHTRPRNFMAEQTERTLALIPSLQIRLPARREQMRVSSKRNSSA